VEPSPGKKVILSAASICRNCSEAIRGEYDVATHVDIHYSGLYFTVS
jgi:hypothetical protein